MSELAPIVLQTFFSQFKYPRNMKDIVYRITSSTLEIGLYVLNLLRIFVTV